MNAPALALLALVPMIIGTVPEPARSITATMCGGGTVTIPLGNSNDESRRDYHKQACHAGNCRQKKLAKLI